MAQQGYHGLLLRQHGFEWNLVEAIEDIAGIAGVPDRSIRLSGTMIVFLELHSRTSGVIVG